MPSQTYVNGQLVKITLTGDYAALDRNRVRGFLIKDPDSNNGLTGGIFNSVAGPEIDGYSHDTNYDTAAADWYSDRVATADAIADSDTTTITISGNTFRIPNALITAVGKTEAQLTTELTAWLATILDTTIEPYATVTQTDPLPTSAVVTD